MSYETAEFSKSKRALLESTSMKKESPSTLPLPGAAVVSNLASLQPRAADGENWNVIIETPKGSRNKYVYDPERGLFKLKKVLPLGNVFPFDFGFVPSTLEDDGDPLDVLVLMDAPAFTGCLVPLRLIGVIEALQREQGRKGRNDRLIAVATECQNQQHVRSIKDMEEHEVAQIEHFFISYHELEGTPFKPIGRRGPKHAERLVKQGMERFFGQLRSSALERAG
jgi:inorganic pyrophosphatase